MEMPEGWKQYQKKIEIAKRLHGFEHIQEDEVLVLMKEMAEALELAEKAVELKFPRTHIQEVLKRFKEWK